MSHIKYYILFILLLLVSSCEKEINWKIKEDKQDLLVVDGILTNEFKPQNIKLSHSYQELNSPVRPFTGANVYISDSTTTYQFTESTDEPGNYFSLPFRAFTGKTYQLTIETGSTSFTAKAFAVPVVPLNKIRINKSGNLFTYDYLESSSPSMTDIFYDWSESADYCIVYGFCSASETYYTLNNVDVSKAFKPERQIIEFPSGTTVIRKNYSLTADHQAFLRSLLMETDWRGGLFDVQAGNVNTNISNGAKGYFAVCMVVSDTTVVR